MFWCGDFNYRIDLPMEDVKEGIMQGDFESLQVEDQLTKSRNSNKVPALLNLAGKGTKLTFLYWIALSVLNYSPWRSNYIVIPFHIDLCCCRGKPKPTLNILHNSISSKLFSLEVQ